MRLQLHQLRQWDVVSSARVDALVANSRFTARRIRCFWRRRAHVLHPPWPWSGSVGISPGTTST